MRLPSPLLRRKNNVHKNDFGHVLVIAGSPRMLGAAALTSLAAMRCGAGLVTVAVPKSLNKSVQAKVSSVVMTWPVPETSAQTISLGAAALLEKTWSKYQSVVIGPGLSDHPRTQAFIRRVIKTCPCPMVIDADALRALAGHQSLLNRRKAETILTPHPGEMSLLTGLSKDQVEAGRLQVSRAFVRQHPCVLVLKGHRSIVAFLGSSYVNHTGNAGMATAGSGDVLSGMIGALLAQKTAGFQAAKFGVYWHGLAGDLAARQRPRASMIASDLIEKIPQALKLQMAMPADKSQRR